jgi:hypothetical protein
MEGLMWMMMEVGMGTLGLLKVRNRMKVRLLRYLVGIERETELRLGKSSRWGLRVCSCWLSMDGLLVLGMWLVVCIVRRREGMSKESSARLRRKGMRRWTSRRRSCRGRCRMRMKRVRLRS